MDRTPPPSPSSNSDKSFLSGDTKTAVGSHNNREVKITDNSESTEGLQSGNKASEAAPITDKKIQEVPTQASMSDQPSKSSSKVLAFGSVNVNPFSHEQAETFWSTLQQEDKGIYGIALDTLYKQTGVSDTDLDLIKGRIPDKSHVGTFEDMFDSQYFKENEIPLRHSQVVLKSSEGKENRICANRISYDGKPYGVALTAKTAVNLDVTLPMVWQEGVGVLVDLHSDINGDGKIHLENNTKAAWDQVTEDHPKTFGEYTVQKESKDDNPDSKTSIQRFKLTHLPSGGERQISRIHFTGWPDSGTISESELGNLHDLVDTAQEGLEENNLLAVNCLAGVGRTGTFFATRRLLDKASDGTLDMDHYQSEVLDTLLQGKAMRNNKFVQTKGQALLVYNFIPVIMTEPSPDQ